MPSPQVRSPGRRRSQARAALVAALAVFLAAHLPFLVTAPTDYDEANFVLGVRDFDVAAHQPHPPGYPVFIGLGKLARPVSALLGAAPLDRGGPAAVESRALAFWAALLGALGLAPLFIVFRNLEDREDVALAATVVTATAPLYWFTAARPLSDVPGLAAVLLVDALLLSAWRRQHAAARATGPMPPDTGPNRLMLAAAFTAGLTAGIRAQTLWLVAPLFLFVIASWRGAAVRVVLRSAGVWAIGVALWLIPLVVASGGLGAYLDALRWQAIDDFAGVQMLVAALSAERWSDALENTFVRAWATRDFARAALGLAAVGTVVLAFRGRRALGLLAVMFLPYAAFHLLFQETATTRYALPLVPAIAYLAMRALHAMAWRAFPIAAALVVAALLVLTLPSFVRYLRTPAPVFAAIQDVARRLETPEYARAVVASHHACARALQVSGLQAAAILPAPLRAEWLQLVDYWGRGGDRPVLFLRDPRRGTLDLIDPLSRTTVERFRWRFSRRRFLGGIRPDLVDLVAIASPPGWFCAEGWHLTPEALGVSAERGRRDATAFVRRRADAAMLVVGGTYADHGKEARGVEATVSLDGRPLARWMLTANRPDFFERLDLAPGALEGAGAFATLSVRWGVPGAPGAPAGVLLTRFDLQSASQPFLVPGPGWHEREYNSALDRDWRWTSDRAAIFVHAAGQDRTLRVAGESPLKYFGAAPAVSVRAGETILARFQPATDFAEDVPMPAATLDRAGGLVLLEVDRTFVPAEAGTSPDRRRLGLRIFELALR